MGNEIAKIKERLPGMTIAKKVDVAKILPDILSAMRKAGAQYEKVFDGACLYLDLVSDLGAVFPAQPRGRGRKMSQVATISIPRQQRSRWRRVREVPEAVKERHKAECKEKEKYPNIYGLLTEWQKELRERMKLAKHTMQWPEGKYQVIYADPPWTYANTGFTQAAEGQYPCLTTDEICALRVEDLCLPETVLFLWVTSPILPEGLEVIKAWGFEYKASFVWCKGSSPGMGWFVRTEHEFLLIATREKSPHPQEKPSSVIEEKAGGHSRKPGKAYELIEAMYPNSARLELFARTMRPGWQSWGNENAVAEQT